MAERIFIGVAWPYANGPLHLGHVAGCYLPADIFARFHRAQGNQVLMVSGSDQHGTPITVRAEQEGKSPAEVAEQYHNSFLGSWEQLGISFDLFTRTGTDNHTQVTHSIFNDLLEKGFIYKAIMPLPYCPKESRFLPDRYVHGTCPHCSNKDARGDQCDECGKPLNAVDLIEPSCSFCGTAPEIRDSEHYFLRLSAFNAQLATWVEEHPHWRPNVYNFTKRLLADGLFDRAITRDIEWGVRVPVAGFENKRIYVWFEAVIGYLSASKEWAAERGEPDAWQEFWQAPTKSYYFIGKDNISFHTIIWPAMIMGHGALSLPYDVPANEFLNLEGRQLSTSRNWAVWVPDYLERYDPDPLRYVLSVNMPEAADTDFSWREFVRRNNDELVATYGNLVHRVLTFTYRNFDGKVPDPGAFDDSSNAILRKAEDVSKTVAEHISLCHFREAIKTAMSLAQEANRYLDEKSPWKSIRSDRTEAATSLYIAISVITYLKTLLYPFLPFSSEKLHKLLGLEGMIRDKGWVFELPAPGTQLAQPEALFVKLDDTTVEKETAKLGVK
ncbi:MAG: methionine--tRNA ligase [Dehalococcoidia bacterium]|nr:methionine--tRNA ligase [Dehalococcoidia bacterium]